MNASLDGKLWNLALTTLRPKQGETPEKCLNRLVRERIADKKLEVNAMTAQIRLEVWATERLRELKRKHDNTNDKDDRRPLVVVEYQNDKLLIDGNHRVNQWLSATQVSSHALVIITMMGQRDN